MIKYWIAYIKDVVNRIIFINQMLKTSAVDKHTLFAALCSGKVDIAPNETIATPSAWIWTELSEQLDIKIPLQVKQQWRQSLETSNMVC